MDIRLPDPPLGTGMPVFGTSISDTEFQGVMTHGLFKKLVPDPRRLEGAQAKYNPELADVADLRKQVNRLITGAKKKNVEPYARYLIRQAQTGEGFTPQIVLWSEDQLQVETDPSYGLGWILVPHEMQFIALDGDTQATARYFADAMDRGLLDRQLVKIVILHGVDMMQAQDVFAVCNTEGTKVTTSMAISLNNKDPATLLTKTVEQGVPGLTGRVNRQKRQLSKHDDDIVTMSALRGAVVCFVEGIGGIQNQTRAVEIPATEMEILEGAARIWFREVTEAMGRDLHPSHREESFASAPAVWAAIGAIGHDVLKKVAGKELDQSFTTDALEHAFAAAANRLGKVDWSRGEHWTSVGAKRSMSGAITLGGPKETGSLIYKALSDGQLTELHPAAP